MKFQIEYNTIENVAGPLVVVGKVRNAQYNEIVKLRLWNGEERLGQVLDTSDTQAVVQVFGPTDGININQASVSSPSGSSESRSHPMLSVSSIVLLS